MALTPTRLFNGVGTEKISNPLGMFPLPNKSTGKSCVYENDFITYDPTDFVETLGGVSGTLGTAANFAVLGASTITTTGTQVVTGDVGLFPGTAITGLTPAMVTGAIHTADSIARQAQLDAMAAYTALSALPTSVIASALDGQTLSAGAYSFASGAATLGASATGTLTLNGSATDVFVIKTASTLTTGAGGIPVITLSGGAVSSNVYWVIGSSATINSGFTGIFRGTIIAMASITDTIGGTVDGRMIAMNGAVTVSAAATETRPTLTSYAGSGLSTGGTAAGLWGWLGLTATSAVESLTLASHVFNFTPATSSVNGLQTWFETRVQLDATVANPDYMLGLTKGFLTTYTSATDGVYFTKPTGAVLWNFVLKSAATGLTTTVAIPGTLPVNSATVDLAYYFDGKGMFYIYFNKVCVATYGTNPTFVGSLGGDLSNIPGPTILLAPTMLNAFHTATSTLLVDCIHAAVDTTRNV